MLALAVNEHHIGVPAAKQVAKPPRSREPESGAWERGNLERCDILFRSDGIISANARRNRRHSRRLLLNARVRLSEKRHIVSARCETTRRNCKSSRRSGPFACAMKK
jgi:hypothetical protein